MDSNIILIGDIVGAVLQPIYFSLFLFYTKGIKDKWVLFTTIMIIETLILRCGLKIYEGINFEILYSISMYVFLRIFYKHARITDFITFIISIVMLGIISVLVYFTLGMNIFSLLLINASILLITYLLRYKLPKIDEFYSKFWNRHNNKKMLKSVTIRGLSSTITMILFVLMYFWLIYIIKS